MWRKCFFFFFSIFVKKKLVIRRVFLSLIYLEKIVIWFKITRYFVDVVKRYISLLVSGTVLEPKKKTYNNLRCEWWRRDCNVSSKLELETHNTNWKYELRFIRPWALQRFMIEAIGLTTDSIVPKFKYKFVPLFWTLTHL